MSTTELLVVARGTDPRRGGQERSVSETLQALADLGVKVTLAAADPRGAVAAAAVPLGVRGRTRAARAAALLRSARDVVARHRGRMPVLSMLPVRGCDLYLPRGGLCPEAYARSAEARSTAAGRWLAHRTLRWGRTRRLLWNHEAALLRDPEGPVLVALSDYVARQGRTHYGLPDGRIRIVPNGVDRARLEAAAPAARRTLGADPGGVLVLAAARNLRLKGIPRLVAAVRGLPADARVQLAVAGARARPRRDPRIRWLGPRDDVPALLRAADALVHPTFYDPSSRVVLEALVLRVPVVTTRWNGAAELLSDSGTVLDDPRDGRALQAALLDLPPASDHLPPTPRDHARRLIRALPAG